MSQPISTVAFIGLGVMGYPMAGHLARAGLTVRVYNRTAAKGEAWAAEHGGSHHPTPREAAEGADLVLVCVGNDDDVRQVTTGEDGALSGMTEGSLLVDHTTASADLAEELDAACRERGIGFVDAPVSGGQQGAENGALTVMCGGSEANFARAEPVLAHYSRAVTLMGPAGSGQLTKMVNQICIAGLVQGLAEGLHFAEQAGLDQQRVVEVISQGAAGSWQMENRHQTMIRDEYEHGFAVDWMRKDLGICLEQARRLQARLPVTALVDQFYADVQVMGGSRWDTSSLLRRLRAFGKA
ncbi:3-hydroxyisobutyrate dehydrogenase-like beta-hydroxyacid dehydrogenase [Halomonas campaniensis]|uniref:3-hydroxyisobutyrate dehydrogenase-like beta-hydroxyacid dehydrogenase n=1 Tax=Halomonas campaniensis TaxID=213554 RepID=A0A7W5PA76_9GAMM|nr:NAD(P)-dependent oxidoreductase [Halomonas campaniensis]MBB3330322.1 3-hydroxyisobutyrate dehydrogenase-like beta-hydroxyacid dehydrogenase [Halomonas campaniensis]